MVTVDAPGTVAPSVARVTVNLPARVWEALSAAADADQISKTEALRRAITTELFLRQARLEGAQILLKRADGTVEQLVFQY